MKALRPYQREAVDSVYEYFSEMEGNPIIVLPTGAGKSLVQATFLHEMFGRWPSSRVMLLTHVKELLQQNAAEIQELWPEAPIGFYSAGLGKKQVAQITVAGIASVYKKAHEMGHVELIIIDECHMLPASGFGMYLTFINELRQFNPKLKVVGMTATPYRLDFGSLTDAGHIFTHYCYIADLRKLIEDGYLLPLRPKRMESQIDLSGVHTRLGEFVAAEVEQEAIKVVEAACDELIEYGADRKSWLLFCAGVDHAFTVQDALFKRGIDASVVTGKTPPVDRDRATAYFQAGAMRCLINVNVLTTGFNAPRTDLIGLLRATKSPGLYVQILGRGMRLSPDTGKLDCLILDYGGNVERHGPIDAINVRKPGKAGDGVAPVKECPNCHALCYTSVRLCDQCGFEFPIDDTPKHEARASTTPLFSWEKNIQTVPVSEVSYSRHVSAKSGIPTLRVTYYSGMTMLREYVCLEHQGGARTRAKIWWERRCESRPPPSVSDALPLVGTLKIPDALRVNFSGKYPEIIGHIF